MCALHESGSERVNFVNNNCQPETKKCRGAEVVIETKARALPSPWRGSELVHIYRFVVSAAQETTVECPVQQPTLAYDILRRRYVYTT